MIDGKQQVGMVIMQEEENGSATKEEVERGQSIERGSCEKDTREDRNREGRRMRWQKQRGGGGGGGGGGQWGDRSDRKLVG